jgi:hypothetical protein
VPSAYNVLVAVINNARDMNILCQQRWYRIPVDSVEKFLKKHWEPEYLAFYQTKQFGSEAYAINYYAQVHSIHQVHRWELFPEDAETDKSQKPYYKLNLLPLQRLDNSIINTRKQRITFIKTTVDKLKNAREIQDLK